jgi:hypothetical protein
MTNRSCAITLTLFLAACSGSGDDDSPGAGVDAGTATCDPSSCDGCCQGNTCVSGSDDTACGSGGEACQSCSGGACQDGTCQALACADTCDGCCAGEVCQPGGAADACGAGGAECAACPVDFICEAGGCVVDPTSRWDVFALRGSVFEDVIGGGSWDPIGGLPDPFVEMATEDSPDRFTGASASIDDTLGPVWDQVVLGNVTARALTSFGIDATILDDDAVGGSDSMGGCRIGVDPSAFAEGEVTSVCEPNPDAGIRGWTLVWRLRRL